MPTTVPLGYLRAWYS